jgi:C4-dicarboxylate-specific signal transduction histidine kinase
VIGYLDLIKANYDKPEQVKKNAQSVEDAVTRIVSIIRQLSSLVVKTRPPVTKVVLQRVLEDAVRRYQADYKIAQPVTITNPVGDAVIETHVEVFEEVLSKVLINAWEAYASDIPLDRRPIAIVTSLVDQKREGKFVQIRVEDQGRGIDPDVRDHMFEPFISTKHTVGVGMGLTVARHSLRNMGGEVSVEDRPGGGAVAILMHPFEQRQRRLAND